MTDDKYAASKAFVKEMRALTRNGDFASIHQAVLQMRDWLAKYPNDVHVGTALEEFDILEEAAEIIEKRKASERLTMSSPIAKAS
jgi:hypothetical protein